MMRDVWLVQFPGGKSKRFKQLAHESRDEFRGRAWCEIEAVLGRRAGDPAVAAGTQVIVDDGYNAPYGSKPSAGSSIYVSTGEPYANRWSFVRTTREEGT